MIRLLNMVKVFHSKLFFPSRVTWNSADRKKKHLRTSGFCKANASRLMWRDLGLISGARWLHGIGTWRKTSNFWPIGIPYGLGWGMCYDVLFAVVGVECYMLVLFIHGFLSEICGKKTDVTTNHCSIISAKQQKWVSEDHMQSSSPSNWAQPKTMSEQDRETTEELHCNLHYMRGLFRTRRLVPETPDIV